MSRVVSAIMFFPRGGSAHATRAITDCLRAQGHEITLVAGSLHELGSHGNARSFYGDVREVEFDQALASADPQGFEGPPGTAPMHPSYEDRAGASDVVFAALDDIAFERQVRAWARELERAGAADADLLYLHHLTPLNEAAARVAPHVPVLTQLHGSELLMLERIATGVPSGWAYADRWAARMRSWARASARVIVVPQGVERAARLLELPRAQFFVVPSGVDFDLFRRRTIDRRAFWKEVLVERPQGWLPGRSPGSARYSESQAAQLAGGAILLYVGRFIAVKRLDRLVGAFGRARRRVADPVGLVLVGGHPGELEGEHPATIAAREHIDGVFLAGWYEHHELVRFYSASDALITASEREQFGLTLVEAMACELPVVATRSLGPAGIIDDGETGWLVGCGDDRALADALVEVTADEPERRRRGASAHHAVIERFSWSVVAAQLSSLVTEVAGGKLLGTLLAGGG